MHTYAVVTMVDHVLYIIYDGYTITQLGLFMGIMGILVINPAQVGI